VALSHDESAPILEEIDRACDETKRWICRNQTLMLEFIPVENGKGEVKDRFKIDCRTRRVLELRVCLSQCERNTAARYDDEYC
jgi:hypothetical protein